MVNIVLCLHLARLCVAWTGVLNLKCRRYVIPTILAHLYSRDCLVRKKIVSKMSMTWFFFSILKTGLIWFSIPLYTYVNALHTVHATLLHIQAKILYFVLSHSFANKFRNSHPLRSFHTLRIDFESHRVIPTH